MTDAKVIPLKPTLQPDPAAGTVAGAGPEVDQTGAEAAATLREWATQAEARRRKQAEERARANAAVKRSYRLTETKK